MFINPDWLTFNEFLFLKPDNQFHWVYWSKIAWWKCRQTHFGKQMVLRQKNSQQMSLLSFCFSYECLFYLSHSWCSFLRIYVSPDRPSWHQITSSKETGQNVWLPQDFKSIQLLRKPMSLRKAIRFPFETSASLKELQIKQISSGFHLIKVALSK